MAAVFVARSTALGKWASDVGLGKHIYRVGYTEEDPKALIAAARWAGESDWKLVKAQDAGDATEDEILARLAGKEKIVDPAYYPRVKGLTGIVRVSLPTVQNNILVQRALAGEAIKDIKITPAEIAAYLIRNVLG